MKGLRIPVMLVLVFVVSAPLFAAPPVQQEDTSALQYATSGGRQNCTDTWGCPKCASNLQGTMSVCVKIERQNGRCVCGNPKPPSSIEGICGTYIGTCTFLY